MNVKTWQVGQEVVADEEAHKNPVVNRTFEIKAERLTRHGHLGGKILTQNGNAEPNEGLLVWLRGLLIKVTTFSVLADLDTGLRSDLLDRKFCKSSYCLGQKRLLEVCENEAHVYQAQA